MNTCPICGSQRIREIGTRAQAKWEGGLAVYEIFCSHCDECENDFLRPDQLRRNKRASVKAHYALLGAPSSTALVAWRERWGLTQEAAGRMLGVGPTAFSKYENAAMLPSAPTARLLHAVVTSDEVTRELARKFGVALADEIGVAHGGLVVIAAVSTHRESKGRSWGAYSKAGAVVKIREAVHSPQPSQIEIPGDSSDVKSTLVRSH